MGGRNKQDCSSIMESQIIKALSQCDKSSNYAELCAAFDSCVRPHMETLLLRTPLLKPPRDSVVPDECAPTVASVRELLRTNTRYGKDDVWFLLLRTGSTILGRHFRKRPRTNEGSTLRSVEDYVAPARRNSGNNKSSSSSRKCVRGTSSIDDLDDGEHDEVGFARCNDMSSASANTTVVTNCFVLFCQHTLPDLSHMTLRWSFVKKERGRFESSDAYVRANAAERRRLQLNSVLAVFSEKAHRHHFTALWTSIIAHMNHAALHIHFLHRLGSKILPNLSNPMIVADYLVGCFASGGVISVLSLHGLFILMLDHGLEYPQYYEQLYSLLTPSAFASRHRYALFRLLELSMTSVRVPLYMVAAFVKKIARTSLLAPLPTLYFILPFIRKLLQSHPSCLALIHRSNKEAIVVPLEECSNATTHKVVAGAPKDTATDALAARTTALQATAALFDGVDPFDASAPLSSTTHALHSTLWELTALERHFLPTIPLMVAAYASTAEDKAPLKFEKTYARLFAAEVTRPMDKQHMPTIAYHAPGENVAMEDSEDNRSNNCEVDLLCL